MHRFPPRGFVLHLLRGITDLRMCCWTLFLCVFWFGFPWLVVLVGWSSQNTRAPSQPLCGRREFRNELEAG